MRERAESIGAAIEWTNPEDGGCRIAVSVATGRPSLVQAGIV